MRRNRGARRVGLRHGRGAVVDALSLLAAVSIVLNLRWLGAFGEGWWRWVPTAVLAAAAVWCRTTVTRYGFHPKFFRTLGPGDPPSFPRPQRPVFVEYNEAEMAGADGGDAGRQTDEDAKDEPPLLAREGDSVGNPGPLT